MKIKLYEIPVKDIVKGYLNSDEEGVVGYNGKLNIRPQYQREFVYKDKQRDAVINTVQNNFPLNVMYWVKNDDDTYEVLDGQQRTISICEYVDGVYSIEKGLRVEWTATPGATGYNVYKNGTKIGSTSKLFYDDTSVSANATVGYTVRGYNASGEETDSVSVS